MSNKARHSELLKRLDTIIELLGNMQRISNLQHGIYREPKLTPDGWPERTEAMKQQQTLRPLSPYQQESPVTEHSAKLSAAE